MKTKVMERLTGFLWVLPHLAGAMTFYFIPFLDVIRRSFLRAADGGAAGLSNYRQVLTNRAFLLAAQNTVKFELVCLPLLILLGLLTAVLLNGSGSCAGICSSLFLIPMTIPTASIVFLWKVLFDSHGLLNGILYAMGLKTVKWMDGRASFYVLVFSYIWKNLGYVVVLFLAVLDGLPAEIYEAARIDGAGRWTSFVHMTLPLIRKGIGTILVLSFLGTFQVFREAYLVAGSYPPKQMYLLPHVFNHWFAALSMDKLAAGAVLSAAVLSFIFLVADKGFGSRRPKPISLHAERSE